MRGVQVYDNTQTDAPVENSLNCRGPLAKNPGIKIPAYRGK